MSYKLRFKIKHGGRGSRTSHQQQYRLRLSEQCDGLTERVRNCLLGPDVPRAERQSVERHLENVLDCLRPQTPASTRTRHVSSVSTQQMDVSGALQLATPTRPGAGGSPYSDLQTTPEGTLSGQAAPVPTSFHTQYVSTPQQPGPSGVRQSSQAGTQDEMDFETTQEISPRWLPAPMLTADEFLALQVAAKLQSNWSNNELLRQISILECFMEGNTGLPTSKHYLTKFLDTIKQFKPMYVVFCGDCEKKCGNPFPVPQDRGFCDSCQKDLAPILKSRRGQFMVLPIRRQLELYLQTDTYFKRIITEFAEMTEAHLKGKRHLDNIATFQFDITLAIDGGTLYKKQGPGGTLPALLLLNNLPTTHQLRFPILGSLFVGFRDGIPPRKVFLENVCQEIREIDANPIKWVDNNGVERTSGAKLTVVITDAPEKSAMMCHVGHGAEYGCQFCLNPGTRITREEFPWVFSGNALRKTGVEGANKLRGGVRYPDLEHDVNSPWRTSYERLEMGKEALQLQLEKNNKKLSVQGVRGFPGIWDVPGFDETDSHVCDSLHVIYHGIFRDIMTRLMKGHGNTFHFAKTAQRDFSQFDSLAKTMTRCHEAERNCYSLSRFTAWTAFDFMMFLTHNWALFCADEDIFKDVPVYEAVVHLANINYLYQHGRPTEETISQLEKEIEVFTQRVKSVFKEEYCTYKFHVLQHFPQFLRNHGAGHATDGFLMERFNLYFRQMASSPNQDFGQIVSNFILKYHNQLFKQIDKFSPQVARMLHQFGVEHDFLPQKFTNVVRCIRKRSNFFNEDEKKEIGDILQQEGFGDVFLDQKNWTNVTQMRRRNILLESTKQPHKAGSMVRDCFVMIDSKAFGEIETICFIPFGGDSQEQGTFVILLRRYEKVRPTVPGWGGGFVYPINQIPYLEPNRAHPKYAAFILKRDTFIQKAHTSTSTAKFAGDSVKLFTVLPNEYLRS